MYRTSGRKNFHGNVPQSKPEVNKASNQQEQKSSAENKDNNQAVPQKPQLQQEAKGSNDSTPKQD